MKKRARELGLVLPGAPGKYNAITDVEGVEVGFSTVIYGKPDDYKGSGSAFARTGVTAILPRGKRKSAVFAGRYDLNGNGELTGTHWIDDSGFLHGPVLITNTNSVGIVREAVAKWMIKNRYYYPIYDEGYPVEDIGIFYPAVGETWDGIMNDISGFHVKEEHALEALDSAKTGFVEEGNVGGGTGMQCHDFKGGTGTASRIVTTGNDTYTVGVLLQANHGMRKTFEMMGIPMVDQITGTDAVYNTFKPKPGTGSVIVVVATDAPLLPTQLSKMCRRVPIGLNKMGAGYENGSGDIFIGFSTANDGAYTIGKTTIEILGDELMDPLYKATAECVEEAVLNAMFMAETMEGIGGNILYALPQDQVIKILTEHGKMPKPAYTEK
jgi:L-aminopeptidase/D-esterase-like protein